MFRRRFTITTIGASSVTLTPKAGTKEEFGQVLNTVVLNFAGTPDSRVFDVTNREIELHIETM